jgi:radical SAM superfamily enzyme YgiQ (UPF0313 family)
MFHVKHPTPHILLINPWITDFAAYNFWLKPLGLLTLAGLLREVGSRVTLVDCLDFRAKSKEYRDGKFNKIKMVKPTILKDIPRYYSQYGMPEESFTDRLFSIETPDLIAFTSGMTYWYPGLFKAISIVKKLFKGVPIILGGIYATLCYDHALKHSGADIIFKGKDETEALKEIFELTGLELRHAPRRVHGSPEPIVVQGAFRTGIFPAFDLYPRLDYVCITTSRGCPFRCTYCASYLLSDGFSRKDPMGVVEEIQHWTTRYRVKNFAFYDDALLMEPARGIIPILEETIRRGLRCNFHAPNGLHIREIDEKLAHLLFQAGFKTIRLGFETSDESNQMETGGKVDNKDCENAVKNLRRAGYSREDIGVYIMVGLPGQRVDQAEESIAYVREMGAKPILVEYSPIPHTPLFEKAKQMSPFDLENEPLFHNNSILPCQWEGLTLADYGRLKEMVRS